MMQYRPYITVLGLIAFAGTLLAASPFSPEEDSAVDTTLQGNPPSTSNPYDPAVFSRQGITNTVVSPGIQPNVWMASTTGKLLSKNPDSIGLNGWTDHTTVTGLTSGTAGVSWTDGTNARERIYYTINGNLHQFNNDNNSNGPDSQLSGIQNYTLESYVAAGTFFDGALNEEETDVAVAGLTSNSLRICVYSGFGMGSPTPGICTSQNTLSTAANGADIAAVNLSTTSRTEFFFVDVNQKLGVILTTCGRFGCFWTWHTLNSPDTNPLRPSIWAGPKEGNSSEYQIVVASYSTSTDYVWAGSWDGNTAHNVTWGSSLPTLPGNPPVLSNAAIGGATYAVGSTTHSLVSIVGSNEGPVYGSLYRISSTNGTWGSWSTVFAGGGDWFESLGTTTGSASGYPRTFLVSRSGVVTTYTLSEYNDNPTPPNIRDHVRLDLGDQVAVVAPANESSAAVAEGMGIAGAIQRNYPPPWKEGLSDTYNNVNTVTPWETGYVVNPMPPFNDGGYQTSLTDPSSAVGPNGLLHFADLELDLDSNCNNAPGSVTSAQIVYRRGGSASVIAGMTQNSPGLWHVDTGASAMDHPSMVVTFDAYDASASPMNPTTHIVYNGDPTTGNEDMRYWSLEPDGGVNAPTPIMSSFNYTSPKALVAIVGAGQTAYAYTVINTPNGNWPTICRLTPGRAPIFSSECGVVTPMGTNVPAPDDDRTVYFGAPQSTQYSSGCPSTGSPLCDGSCFFKCFVPEQAIAIAADPTTSETFYAAYQAKDPSSPSGTDLSIYFTMASQSYSNWSTPVVVNSRQTGDTTNYLNPAITVDASGTIVITYSAIHSEDDSSDQTGNASVFASWATTTNNGAGAWTVANRGLPYSTWNALTLPYHCGRFDWFLGEYHTGSVAGGGSYPASHAYQIYPYSIDGGTTQGTTQQRGRFFSQWAM